MSELLESAPTVEAIQNVKQSDHSENRVSILTLCPDILVKTASGNTPVKSKMSGHRVKMEI